MVGRLKLAVVAAVALTGLAACDNGGQGSPGGAIESLTGPALVRDSDPKVIEQGGRVFRQHCAQCHGQQAEGDPDWRKPDAEGKYPPPPLNGTGHAWHHPKLWLKQMIQEGSRPQGNMPAWRDKLTDDEIEAVIAWFQSQGPDRVYAAWHEMQNR